MPETPKKEEAVEPLTEASITKYTAAGQIVNDVLKELMGMATEGTKVGDICTHGDTRIKELTSKCFKKEKEMEKGIGMPTCVSVGHIACHFSPLKSDPDVLLEKGQLVKIDLGAHVDGYIASAAHTFVVGASSGEKVTGKKADVTLAAYNALEATLRQLFPHKGLKNTDITKTISEVAGIYKTTPVENMLSHQIGRFDSNIGKEIIQNPSDDQVNKIEKHIFEENEAYIIDILITTGDGKVKHGDIRTTVYKKSDNVVYQLKMKNSRNFFSEASKEYGVMPFSIRGFANEVQAKLGVIECERHGLLQAYPVLYDRDSEFVAQFKATVLITPSGIVKVAGLPLDTSVYQSDVKIENPSIQSLLKESLKMKKQKKKDEKTAGETKETPKADPPQ
uniref:Peptidase M24 domain-containing protein n=1 Tax=Panagrolaimus sp. ES5 TaxID=591445 RepID=A0AC34GU08_9BILA